MRIPVLSCCCATLAAALAPRPASAQPTLVPPVVITQIPARTPADIVLANDVDVSLRVTVDSGGHVGDVEVLSSGGHPLDQAAVEAARHWVFQPARRQGVPVVAVIRLSFQFPRSEPAFRGASTPASPRVSEGPVPGAASNPASASATSTASTTEPPEPGDTVVIVGTIERPLRGASDQNIRIGALRVVPRKDAGQLLKLAPGIFLTNEGGSGHPYQIFLRGFDAREGQDIELTVDGIPINQVGSIHGNGLADTHFIIPELVRGLRIVEGPYDPAQGNFAVAGSAQYELGVEERGTTLQLTAGSFGTQRALATWAPSGGSIGTFGGAEVVRSDGAGSNRGSERGSAMAGYETRIGSTGTLKILAQSYATHYQQAGVLRVDDVASGKVPFLGTYDSQQGGDASRHSISLRADDRLGKANVSQQVFLVSQDFRLRENLTGFVQDVQQSWQDPHPQRGDLIDQRSSSLTLGGRGSSRVHERVGGLVQELEVGYLGRFDKVSSTQQRDRSGTTIPYRKELDLDSSLSNVGLYADGALRPISWLTFRGGVRADYFHYDVHNRCALPTQASFGGDAPNTECFSSDRVGYRSPDQRYSTGATILQPRVTALLGSFAGFLLSVSYGHGARSLDPQYIAQDAKTPFARVVSKELGVSYVKSFETIDIQARSVFFETQVDHDLFFNQTEGRATLANGTTRTGWAGSARATGSFFDLATNLTFVRATFDDTKLLIPYVPDAVLRADGSLFGPLPLAPQGIPMRGSLGLGFSYVGARPLPFDERSDVTAVMDASASVRWRAVELGVFSTNVLDRKYRMGEYNYTSNFRSANYATLVPSRHFTAGEPRAVFGVVTLHLESSHGS